MRMDKSDGGDLKEIHDEINKELGDLYVVTVIKNTEPLLAGSPTHTGRLMAVRLLLVVLATMGVRGCGVECALVMRRRKQCWHGRQR